GRDRVARSFGWIGIILTDPTVPYPKLAAPRGRAFFWIAMRCGAAVRRFRVIRRLPHSTCSIVALRRGTAEIGSARWSGTARAGDVFFLNRYEFHSACCSGEDAEHATLCPALSATVRNGPGYAFMRRPK